MRNDAKGNAYNHTDIEMEGHGAPSKDRDDDIHYTGSDSASFDAAKEDHFGEAIVVTDAKDLLTHVIHVDDDPTLSPWTFRTAFLGKEYLGFRTAESADIPCRYWTGHLRFSPAGNLLFQTASHLCVHRLHDGRRIRDRRVHVRFHSSKGCYREVV